MRRKPRVRIRAILLYSVAVLVLMGGSPMAVLADDSASPTTTTDAPAAPPKTYTYDPVTNRWNTDTWYYNQTSGQYELVPTPPPPVSTSDDTAPLTAPTSDSQTVAPASSGTSTTQATGTANTTNTIENTETAQTQSGDATVSHNTAAGNATSGNATTTTTTINTINSAVASSGAAGMTSFTSNISGDVYGDILLYPTILNALSKATINPAEPVASVTVNADTTNHITNTIQLDTASGAATVTDNTSAGSATSGTANSVANVMNVINSIIAANSSFVGTINIYGNLNGDILIAPDFMTQLLASNADDSTTGTLALNTSDTQSIVNNVNLSAVSGAATVTDNTSTGGATSGTAATNVVILNLSGHQIVASNSLLVFVNVLGRWVGVIVDVPTGGTAAMIGNGVAENDVDAGTVSTRTDTGITNNITLNSQSGDATVSHNTAAGNATSGNATASANILNMSQSTVGLSGWFGVLFINVFGSWLGSFGINTPNGDPRPPVDTEVNSSPGAQTPGAQPAQVFQFIARTPLALSSQSPKVSLVSSNASAAEPAVSAEPAAVLGTTSQTPRNNPVNPAAAGYDASVILATIMGVLALAVIVRNSWLLVRG